MCLNHAHTQTAACDEQHPRSQSEVRTPRRYTCQDREPVYLVHARY